MAVRHAYFVQRVLDTMLREDLFGIVSKSEWKDDWLRFQLNAETEWYIPVVAARQLQPWRSSAPVVVEHKAGEPRKIVEVQDLIESIVDQVDEQAALREEIICALEHDQLSTDEQQRWFATHPKAPADWVGSLRFYDRLGSFLDHPYYPTARAKVGLDEAALRAYAPEFGATFELCWVSVATDELSLRQGQLPDWWPTHQQVGLSPNPERILVPVHPHTVQHIGATVAPRTAIRVAPTLSVRTMMLVDHPQWHLKLPLFMRSLSYKNIRRIKPSTIVDGDAVQTLLKSVVESDPRLNGICLFTDESAGLSVQERSEFGCILRHYPALGKATVLPTAALLALTPQGGTVIDALVAEHYGGDRRAFFRAYLELTQNSLLVLQDGVMRLLLKDNDAARIHAEVARQRLTSEQAAQMERFQDPCLKVNSWLDIGQMFLTITLQLNILPFLEAEYAGGNDLYPLLRECLDEALARIPEEQIQESQLRELLLDPELHYVKYLFSAGTLFSKQRTGAADINKHYGLTAPNCFR
jgi:siderophore synthetase component